MSNFIRLAILMILLSGLVGLNPGFGATNSQPERLSITNGSSENYNLDWVAVGEVSGGTGSSDHYQLSTSIGQMGAGTRSESEHYALCVGFQCGSIITEYQVFLPLAKR